MTFTKEQKQAYLQGLRNRWRESKALAEADETAKALWNETGGKVSYLSFYFVLQDMRRLGLDGLPYIDCKTFGKWREAGFVVKKGEHSKIDGIVWIGAEPKDEEDEEDRYLFPKVYHLFHETQVEAIK